MIRTKEIRYTYRQHVFKDREEHEYDTGYPAQCDG